MEDGNIITYAKARNLYLGGWKECNTIIMYGAEDGDAYEKSYKIEMMTLSGE